jgi:hypothetical protein
LSWLLLALQVILSAVLIAAAAEKLLRSDEFFAALRLSHRPEGVVAAVGVAVPAIELALALALLLAPAGWLPFAFGAVALLFAAFTAWMGWVRASGLRIRCGCFGLSGGRVGPRTIGRNFVLLCLALAGLILAMRTSTPLPEPSLPMAVTVTALAACLALLIALRSAWPRLILNFGQYQARQAGVAGGK